MLDTENLRKAFPIFRHQPDLVYLDSAATALKPASVIEAERKYLEEYSANVARGLYAIAEKATTDFEAVREKVAQFIGAETEEIIFTPNTTASINLAAELLAGSFLAGENIITTELEHHSNYLPWKELAQKKGLEFRVLPLTLEGKLDREKLEPSVDEKTRLVAFSAVSNVLGTIQPVKEIIEFIKKRNPKTLVLVDAAQAIGHTPIRTRDWNADFIAFSAHKMFGPTGVGALYGKKELLRDLPPVHFGGGMVLDACADDTLYKESPYRFEAGTPNIAGVIAWNAALDFIAQIDPSSIRTHELRLATYAQKQLLETFGETIQILGPRDPEERGGVLAFVMPGLHPHDIAQILGERNVCIRAGEHCAAPLHRRLGLAATARVSFSVYNTEDDIDALISALKEAEQLLGKRIT